MFGVVLLGFFALLLLAGGVVLGVWAWRNLQSASQLQHPLSRIGKLQPGFRKIRGKIAAMGRPLQSPLGNRECVYYRLRVYEERRSAKGEMELPGGIIAAYLLFGWTGALLYRSHEVGANESRTTYSQHLLVDEQDEIPLVIEDDTGCVEVDLRGAKVFTKEKTRIASGDDRPPPSHLGEMLAEDYGIPTVDRRGFFKSLHFLEEVLPLGAKVTVVGPIEELRSGDLCFQAKDGPLVVSEQDVVKEGKSARNRGIGLSIGAAAALGGGLGCLLGTLLLLVQTQRVRR